ncbi:hypothetical protein HDU83_001878 [Entophlyctis luteolus]|nr:hypothetical protein HDU83_001878 [Entophlyctis luteolus]
MNRDIWYLLVDERGDPAFEGVGANFVSIGTEGAVGHLRKKVWEVNKKDLLLRISAARLKVYSNKDDIADPAKALEVDAPVIGMGEDKRTTLFVVVPKKDTYRPLSEETIEKILSAILARVREGFAESKESKASMSEETIERFLSAIPARVREVFAESTESKASISEENIERFLSAIRATVSEGFAESKELEASVSEETIERFLSAIPARVRQGFAESKELEASMSRASSNFRRNLFNGLNLASVDIVIPELPQVASNGSTPFLWHNSEEDSAENKYAYLSFIRCKFGNFPRLRIYDGDHEDSSLETSLNEFSLTGNADCLISSTDASERCVDTCHLLFELRKPTNRDMKLKQTELELLAADSKSSYPVLAVVSDLIDSWKVLWIKRKRGRKVICSSQYLGLDFAIEIINGYLWAVQNMLNRVDFEFDGSDFVGNDDPNDDEDNRDEFGSGMRRRGRHATQSNYKFFAVKLRDNHRQRTAEDFEIDGPDVVQAMIRSFVYKNKAQLLRSAAAAEIN